MHLWGCNQPIASLQLNYLPAMPDYAAINAHNSLIARREAYWNLNQTAPNSPECLSAKYAYANALMGNDDSTAFRLLMDCEQNYKETGDTDMMRIAFGNAMLTLARIAYRKSDDAFELAKAYGVSL